jgi:CheY-like chemotaxis protein
MEAIGQLAGGVAHDFNNILTAIIGYGNLIRMKLPPQDTLRPYVEQILASSERAAQLTHSLLAFSRKHAVDLKLVSLNGIIQRVEKLLVRLIGEDISLKSSLVPGEITVMADSVQLEHVLMNLATNARDAMTDGGHVSIETSIYEMNEEFIKAHAYGEPGRYALVRFSDTGTGMDEALRKKIFDPFFTTKEAGKGTGLGLAMVYGIIKQHKGYITVTSQPGRGTTFNIYLPLIALSVPETKQAPVIVVPRGGETVLLAEDDNQVRSLTRTVLEDFGYQVIEAEDGDEAVRKFREHGDKVDLLVLDIVMPKKNGKEAYLAISDLRPGIKAIFTSGYTADIIQSKGILDTGMEFILKPISPTLFLQKVREVLDRK